MVDWKPSRFSRSDHLYPTSILQEGMAVSERHWLVTGAKEKSQKGSLEALESGVPSFLDAV